MCIVLVDDTTVATILNLSSGYILFEHINFDVYYTQILIIYTQFYMCAGVMKGTFGRDFH